MCPGANTGAIVGVHSTEQSAFIQLLKSVIDEEYTMNTAIIAEYNPFHKGHLYHINKTRKAGSDNIIAIISGNFVQRGEPAIIDKHQRAKAALLNGVDMVIELPVEYATSSADVFAFGGCDIIKKSNIIDSISFGCEQGFTEDFINIAKLLKNETEKFKEILKSELCKGVSYPAARTAAIGKCLNINTEFLNNPNNILALEYLKNIQGTNIKPIAIKRHISDYNGVELTGEISSASAIRKSIIEGNNEAFNSIPDNTQYMFENIKHIPDIDDYSSIFHYILRTQKNNLSQYADITEGLDNRILAFANNQKISQLIEQVKTKRYTYSKIKRAILHIILGITKKDQDMTGVKYIRVLGVRKDKINILSELCSKSSVPVITKVIENEELLKKEILTTDIYNLLFDGEIGREYREKFITI